MTVDESVNWGAMKRWAFRWIWDHGWGYPGGDPKVSEISEEIDRRLVDFLSAQLPNLLRPILQKKTSQWKTRQRSVLKRLLLKTFGITSTICSPIWDGPTVQKSTLGPTNISILFTRLDTYKDLQSLFQGKFTSNASTDGEFDEFAQTLTSYYIENPVFAMPQKFKDWCGSQVLCARKLSVYVDLFRQLWNRPRLAKLINEINKSLFGEIFFWNSAGLRVKGLHVSRSSKEMCNGWCWPYERLSPS